MRDNSGSTLDEAWPRWDILPIADNCREIAISDNAGDVKYF
jgi:hypothetical protein